MDACANTVSQCSLALRLNSLTLEDVEELFRDEWLTLGDVAAIVLVVVEFGIIGEMDRLVGRQHAHRAVGHTVFNINGYLKSITLTKVTFEWKGSRSELMCDVWRHKQWLKRWKAGRRVGRCRCSRAQHTIHTIKLWEIIERMDIC